jgi:hypothetical protein
VRLTADIDLVLDLEPEMLRRAIAALSSLGYRPRAPVDFAEFADPAKRRKWAREKGLTVFSVFSPDHRATELDLFVEPPFDFERVYSRAARFAVADGIDCTFVGLDDLIEMKRKVARPQDLEDIKGLESLRDSRQGGDA